MKKKYFINKKPIAYYSGINGLEIYGIEYGVEDYIYYTTGAWSSKLTHHKSKIYYTKNAIFFLCHGYRIKLNDCINM